jgi:hypothetical protein
MERTDHVLSSLNIPGSIAANNVTSAIHHLQGEVVGDSNHFDSIVKKEENVRDHPAAFK